MLLRPPALGHSAKQPSRSSCGSKHQQRLDIQLYHPNLLQIYKAKCVIHGPPESAILDIRVGRRAQAALQAMGPLAPAHSLCFRSLSICTTCCCCCCCCCFRRFRACTRPYAPASSAPSDTPCCSTPQPCSRYSPSQLGQRKALQTN
jgi:hypothetical protein